MAATKTIEQFPGVYSGQGRSWEKRIKTRINLLRPVDGIRPKVALEPRAPNTITATAAVVSEEERIAYGAGYIGVDNGKGTVTPRKLATTMATPISGVSTGLPSPSRGLQTPAPRSSSSASGTARGASA